MRKALALVLALLSGPAGACVWSEAEYLRANPDVAAGVQAGWLSSGLDHFQAFGQAEGRQGCWELSNRRADEFAVLPIFRTSQPGPAPGPGFVNSGLYVQLDQLHDTRTFEWAIVGTVRVHGDGTGEPVGGYFQGWRLAGVTSPVWGLVAEAAYYTPGGTVIGQEITLRGNGRLDHGGGLDIPLHRTDMQADAASVPWAIRMSPQPGNVYRAGIVAAGTPNQYPEGVLSVPECTLAVAINGRPNTGLRFCAGKWELVTDGVAHAF